MLGKIFDYLLPSFILLLAFFQLYALEKTCKVIRLSAYLPDYRFATLHTDSSRDFVINQLDDIFLFSLPFDRSVDMSDVATKLVNDSGLLSFSPEKDTNFDIYLSLGGGGKSQDFLEMATTGKEVLLENLIHIFERLPITGFDFDPEIQMTKDAYKHLFTLIYDLKQATDGLKISLAVHHWQNPGKDIFQIVDRVHLMTYDMQQGQHSSLDRTQAVVRTFERLGLVKSKMFVGIPLYGRHENDVRTVKTFSELVSCDSQLASVDIAQRTYFDGFFYNGHGLVKFKTEWVISEELGGIFFWELGQDCLKRDVSLLEHTRNLISIS